MKPSEVLQIMRKELDKIEFFVGRGETQQSLFDTMDAYNFVIQMLEKEKVVTECADYKEKKKIVIDTDELDLLLDRLSDNLISEERDLTKIGSMLYSYFSGYNDGMERACVLVDSLKRKLMKRTEGVEG